MTKTKDEKKESSKKVPKTFCERYGNLLSVAVGISLSASFVVPMLLLTDTPCTTTQNLKRGEQLLCVAPWWAGTGNLEFLPGKGLAGYIFEKEPDVDTSSPLISDKTSGNATISSFSFTYLSSWMLNGSSIRVTVNASRDVDVFLINETAFEHFKYGETFDSLEKHEKTKFLQFEHVFTPPYNQSKLQRLTVLIRNGDSANVDVQWLVEYSYTRLNLTGALSVCNDKESCSFSDIREGLFMIAVAHDNLTETQSRLTMGWSYHARMKIPGVLVVLVVFVVVVTTVVLLVVLNQKKSLREARERQQLHSEASSISPAPSLSPSTL